MIDWWKLPQRVIAPELILGEEPASLCTERRDGAQLILAGTGYDPGSQAYRFHSAINETTEHASVFCRMGDNNPYGSYRQLDILGDEGVLQHCMQEADIVICHMNYMMLELLREPLKDGATLVRFYHGSVSPEERRARGGMEYLTPFQDERDQELGAVQVGARWDHVLDSDGRVGFVGMAVPCDRYADLREIYQPLGIGGEDRPLRVGHSPTYREFKGTEVFIETITRMKAKGVNVEMVLIENMEQSMALRAKATCDVFFDSFWLGLQGSGLEAQAMGIPVIAGDHKLARLHREYTGQVPWVFADRMLELEAAIEMLIKPYARHTEMVRQNIFVNEWHSYAAVAKRFEDLVIKPRKKPLAPKPEPVTTPAPEPVQVPPKEPMRTT